MSFSLKIMQVLIIHFCNYLHHRSSLYVLFKNAVPLDPVVTLASESGYHLVRIRRPVLAIES